MSFTVEQVVQEAVEQKRKGNFKGAIDLYNLALSKVKDQPIIYLSLAKSLYLYQKNGEAIDNYISSLILNIASSIKSPVASSSAVIPDDMRNLFGIPSPVIVTVDMLTHSEYQIQILSEYFNTLIHLGHAYVDFSVDAQNEIIDLLLETGSIKDRRDLQHIIAHEISKYRIGLAGGGIKAEPIPLEVSHDIDFSKIYKSYGMFVAKDIINWEQLKQSLS